MTVLLILLLLVLAGSLAQGQEDVNDQWSRVSWQGIAAGLLLASSAPNPFASILIAGLACGMFWHAPMSQVYRDKVAQGLVLIAVYVVAAPRMQAWMVTPLLAAMGAVGALTGLWAIYSSLQSSGDRGFAHEYLGGWLRVVDRSAMSPLAGQGNFNHTQSVGAVAVAAALGLGTFWALPLGLLSLAAVLLSSEGRMTGKWVSQGLIHLAVLGLCLFGITLLDIRWALVLWGSIMGGILIWAHPWNPRKDWYDSNRFLMWNLAIRKVWWTANQPQDPAKALAAAQMEHDHYLGLQEQAAADGNALVHNQMTMALIQNAEMRMRWEVLAMQAAGQPLTPEERGVSRRLWAQRMRVRLLGCGTGTWYPLMKWPALLSTGVMNETTKKLEGAVYCSAHNEYVEVLFELGILGLLAAIGLAVSSLWATFGTPVFLLVVTLCSVAFLNFPFSLFANVEKSDPSQPDQFVGCPALTAFTLLIFLLIEAVR